MRADLLNAPDVRPLQLGQRPGPLVFEELQIPEDRVHGATNFVADGRGEHSLRPTALLSPLLFIGGELSGLRSNRLRGMLSGRVSDDFREAAHASARLAQRGDRHPRPERRPVAADAMALTRIFTTRGRDLEV